MTLEQAGIIVSILTAIFASIFSHTQWRERFAKLEVKVDTMWDFQLRRAESEAVKLGIGRKNSPFKLDDKAKEWIKPLEQKLKTFFAEKGCKLSDRDLAIEIERNFGEEITSVVCIPKGLSDGACLLIALAVMKDEAKT